MTKFDTAMVGYGVVWDPGVDNPDETKTSESSSPKKENYTKSKKHKWKKKAHQKIFKEMKTSPQKQKARDEGDLKKDFGGHCSGHGAWEWWKGCEERVSIKEPTWNSKESFDNKKKEEKNWHSPKFVDREYFFVRV